MKQVEFQTRRSQTDCQTYLFAVITARQQGGSSPRCVPNNTGVQDSTDRVSVFHFYIKHFSSVLQSNGSRPSPSGQLKGTESALSFLFNIPNHGFLAPFKGWKAAIPFKSRRTIEK